MHTRQILLALVATPAVSAQASLYQRHDNQADIWAREDPFYVLDPRGDDLDDFFTLEDRDYQYDDGLGNFRREAEFSDLHARVAELEYMLRKRTKDERKAPIIPIPPGSGGGAAAGKAVGTIYDIANKNLHKTPSAARQPPPFLEPYIKGQNVGLKGSSGGGSGGGSGGSIWDAFGGGSKGGSGGGSGGK